MRFGWNSQEASARIRGLAKTAALVFLAIYVLIYWVEPFSGTWNLIVTDFFLVIAASMSAVIATLIWARYDPTDAPRRVWTFFTIGLWLWVVAEFIWGYLNVRQGEVPVGVPDIFWVASYFFMIHALVFQYRILAQPSKQELVSRAFLAVLLLLAFFLFIYRVLAAHAQVSNPLDLAVNSFYPAADLLLVLIALWLARNFMGGAFSRPWLGLLAFAVADLLYAWVEISGLYSWGTNQANLLSTLTDVVYIGAYLVFGIGILSYWVFLKYGLRSPIGTR